MKSWKHLNYRWAQMHIALLSFFSFIDPSTVFADLALETETARPVLPGHMEIGLAFEYQTSSAGEEYALPMAFEAGIFDRLELLVEPVPITQINSHGSPAATGLGDTEISLA